MKREDKAFDEFMVGYRKRVGQMDYRVLSKWGVRAIIGLMLTAASSTLLAFALAAFAELQKFFPDAPMWVLLTISILVSVSAVGGVEGYIVATGMQEGFNKSLAEVGKTRAWAAVILLFVSIVAALYQRSFLTNDPLFQTITSFILSFVSAIGIPVAIFMAAPYLGVMITLPIVSENEYVAKARDEFRRTKEGKLTRRDVIELSRQSNKSSKIPSTASERAPQPIRPEAGEIIAWYLEKTGLRLSDGDLSSMEIARDYASSKGWALDPESLKKFGTAIRTALSRERERQGVIIVRGSTNGNGHRSN